MEEVRLDLRADANRAILWRDGDLYLLDQRQLPHEERYVRCRDARATADAIRAMVVRGAPAIGITAAYGVALAGRLRHAAHGAGWKAAIAEDFATLAASRPTAVNLFWALDRMRGRVVALPDGADPGAALLAEAQAIHAEDVIANRVLGDLGAALIAGPTDVVTHCNTGGLATGGHGTALGVIRSAWAQGLIGCVYADETRPWLQGSRLTAWELARDGIPVSLMADGAAAARMARGGVGWAIVGADRIAANGDTANKIGTYGLAVAARYHGVRFMVAAPTSTIDRTVATGAQIPIEERDPAEVLSCGGRRVGAPGVDAWNPVFDVTPAALIDAIVTERGVVLQPTAERIAALFDA
ncbi:MAG: S-methyl-5-thioribose-1-phosphate isomerase [Gammaproteobacteria bacterium]|jgi:methylthioribose-1-phosphate isomerase|nr:S-methyl-5-thioribose-1-phosphate isomerase [Gammaproteobacteria bacterium]